MPLAFVTAGHDPAGDVDQASSLLKSAVTQRQEVGDSFGRARALLALGVLRRRARQKRTARDAIRAALDGFEQLEAGYPPPTRTVVSDSIAVSGPASAGHSHAGSGHVHPQ